MSSGYKSYFNGSITLPTNEPIVFNQLNGDTITMNAPTGTSSYNLYLPAGTGPTGSALIIENNDGNNNLYLGFGDLITGYTGATGVQGFTSGQILYFNYSVSSEFGGYYSLNDYPVSSTEQIVTSPGLSSSQTLVAAFITPVGYPGVTSIQGGLYNFNVYASVSLSSTTTTIYANIYTACF
jgi:hypothetical protein